MPPAAGARPPTDVVCVVDVSGSMGIECTNGDAEAQVNQSAALSSPTFLQARYRA